MAEIIIVLSNITKLRVVRGSITKLRIVRGSITKLKVVRGGITKLRGRRLAVIMNQNDDVIGSIRNEETARV
jgi:hypothetical protein